MEVNAVDGQVLAGYDMPPRGGSKGEKYKAFEDHLAAADLCFGSVAGDGDIAHGQPSRGSMRINSEADGLCQPGYWWLYQSE